MSGNDCVEVAVLDPAGHTIGIRDSKNATGPIIAVPLPHWRALLGYIKKGNDDLTVKGHFPLVVRRLGTSPHIGTDRNDHAVLSTSDSGGPSGHHGVMTARTRIVAGLATGSCGLVTVGLVVLVVAVDLDTADKTASVVGALAGLAGTAVSVYVLSRTPEDGSSVEASGARSVAAGGGIGRAVTGDRVQTGPAPAPQASSGSAGPAGPVRASGDGSVAAGGDIHEAVTGDETRP
ncbi:DUF397 domain-containing protein [Actinomadura madurae]|nr:DUF397 domain-containing protein [Actinomadura madurae]